MIRGTGLSANGLPLAVLSSTSVVRTEVALPDTPRNSPQANDSLALSPGMNNPGKVVVFSILAIALAMAGMSWGWNYLRTQKTLAFWGKEGTILIKRGPQVKTFQIQPQTAPKADNLVLLKEVDISKAPGLVNARQPLLDDGTFEWSASPTDAPATYTHGVEFRQGENLQTLLFDFEKRLIFNLQTEKAVQAIPKIMTGWRNYSQRHLSDDEPPGKTKPGTK